MKKKNHVHSILDSLTVWSKPLGSFAFALYQKKEQKRRIQYHQINLHSWSLATRTISRHSWLSPADKVLRHRQALSHKYRRSARFLWFWVHSRQNGASLSWECKDDVPGQEVLQGLLLVLLAGNALLLLLLHVFDSGLESIDQIEHRLHRDWHFIVLLFKKA